MLRLMSSSTSSTLGRGVRTVVIHVGRSRASIASSTTTSRKRSQRPLAAAA